MWAIPWLNGTHCYSLIHTITSHYYSLIQNEMYNILVLYHNKLRRHSLKIMEWNVSFMSIGDFLNYSKLNWTWMP